MRLILFILIIQMQNLFGASYLFYPKEDSFQELKNHLQNHYQVQYKNIFSKNELKNIKMKTSVLNAVKANIKGISLKTLKDDPLLKKVTVAIEQNHKVISHSLNEYQSLQWAIYNDGTAKDISLSDIDQMTIPAKFGEDIQVHGQVEKEKQVKVAVIDSGIDQLHPDLKNKIYTKKLECEALNQYQDCLENSKNTKTCEEKWAHYDSDKNGYPMDCQGWNVAAPINAITEIQGNQKTQDLIGHGTHVAGIIAAEDNQIGVKGVIQNVKIVPVKVSGSEEEYEEDNTTDIFAKGILYAIKSKVDIINLSVGWASNEDSLLVTEMMNLAHQQGILIVVAAGNSAHSEISYPCAYHEVICVGAHLPNGQITHFSNKGASVDLLAPGMSILSTWPLDIRPKTFVSRHGYEYKNGTSFAAPYVVGVLARLINYGLTPQEAKVSMLQGTRKNKTADPFWAINGNLDFKKSLKQELNSFIYPFKKTPALINWNKAKKKMVVRLKNYLKNATNVKIHLSSTNSKIKVLNQTIQMAIWKKDEVKDLEFFLQANESIDSDLKFKLNIESNDEKKSYPIQGTALTVIHSDFSRDDTQSFFVKSKAPLESMSFKSFKNIDPYNTHDFLVIDSSQKVLRLALMKNFGNEYKLSRFIDSPFPEPYLAHLAKLDLDNDQKEDYVVIGFIKDEQKEDSWLTKFLVFDHNFKPKNYLIAPNNEFDNLLATINTGLVWTLQGDKRVPTWIASGYCPSEDLKKATPWEPSVKNSWKKRIFYLSDQRLHCINIDNVLNDEKEYVAHSFIKQNNSDLKNGEVKILFSEKVSFKKDYLVANLNQLKSYKSLSILPYRNISNLNPIFGTEPSEIFFTEIVKNNTIAEVTMIDTENLSIEQEEFFYQDPFDPLQMLISYHKNDSWALTKYNLLYLNGNQVQRTESRNTDYQVQYKKLQHSPAIYLPSIHTPGYSSELINVDINGEIYRSSDFRFLPYESCQEIDFVKSHWQQKDKIVFYCSDKRKLIIVDLTKGITSPFLKSTKRLQTHKEEL